MQAWAQVSAIEWQSSGAKPLRAAGSIALLGVGIDNVTMAETVEQVDQMVKSRLPHHVVTANVDFLVQAIHDAELRRVLMEAQLVLCDGMPLVWASRLLGNPLRERVAGADLVPLLIRLAEAKGYQPYFLGGAPEVTAQAVANVRRQYPRLKIAGYYSPPFRPLREMNDEEICKQIRAARPDMLFVSFGCPKAEKWIAMHYRSLGVPVVMGVGATVDFLAGQMKRAPSWMQRSGGEWLFRLLQEPRRLLPRYSSDLWYFGNGILRQWWHLQHAGRAVAEKEPAVSYCAGTTWQHLRVSGRLDSEMVSRHASVWDQIPLEGHDCLVDLSQVKCLDSSGVGLLLHLQKRLHAAGTQMVLESPSPAVRHSLRLMRLEEFFPVASCLSDAWEVVQGCRGQRGDLFERAWAPVGVRIAWRGEVTAANAGELWRQAEDLAGDFHSSQSGLMVDLSAVTFVDREGLALMVRMKRHAGWHGVTVRFVGLQPQVLAALRVAGEEEFLIGAAS